MKGCSKKVVTIKTGRMKRFLITSTKFTGTAEIFYNAAGILNKIDCTDTDMDAYTIAPFKRAVSPTLDDIAKGFSNDVSIVETSIEVKFEMFWDKYKRKINRKRAEALFNKLSQSDQVKAYYGIDGYNKFLKSEGYRSKQDPDTYLTKRTWENEY